MHICIHTHVFHINKKYFLNACNNYIYMNMYVYACAYIYKINCNLNL